MTPSSLYGKNIKLYCTSGIDTIKVSSSSSNVNVFSIIVCEAGSSMVADASHLIFLVNTFSTDLLKTLPGIKIAHPIRIRHLGGLRISPSSIGSYLTRAGVN